MYAKRVWIERRNGLEDGDNDSMYSVFPSGENEVWFFDKTLNIIWTRYLLLQRRWMTGNTLYLFVCVMCTCNGDVSEM